MRLIDADDALKRVKPYEPSDEEWIVTGGTALRLICKAIDNAPTVDAAPVVQCRDCDHLFGTLCAVCGLLPRKPDDFCSYGKRKEGADGEST